MKKIKPDEYFGNGLIEAARFGNTVVTHNNMTEEQHKGKGQTTRLSLNPFLVHT